MRKNSTADESPGTESTDTESPVSNRLLQINITLHYIRKLFIVGGEVFNNSPCVSRQHTPIIPDLGIKPEKKLTFLG